MLKRCGTMIEGYSPVAQALMGTLLTWGLTAAGAAMVFVFSARQKHILDGSLGFAAGVMLAASYWSLLAPAIDMAEDSGKYGSFAFLPVAVGFTLGAAFVYLADVALPFLGVSADPNMALALASESKIGKEKEEVSPFSESQAAIKLEEGLQLPRKRVSHWGNSNDEESENIHVEVRSHSGSSWRRILLLILAITIHNIPEGLAVGVGFGAIGKTSSATLESARNLAIGIGIQNFPEGLAVSLPLRGAGVSTWTAFWYGQLSGMVEPIAGTLGAVAVVSAEPLLPYALAFAAGAMVYVVVDDIIPEAQVSGNGKLASWTAILGFTVMMSLDVGLG
ncbi:zinc transporter ZIP11 isoform X3 [Syngnathus acus]|uniref:zinc transporter ZIP11 isoform X3 n=1 Tax=Syngnathus acus TaxID=161584 RepID=UPI00188641C0|nr:zinc transporter ZIP11 isoform X3 [Syngnathus acus]